MTKSVLIVMGSESDFEVVRPCISTLKQFGILTEVNVLSAHRTPHEATTLASKAYENGFSCIIAAAGKAAHLPGVLAAFTNLPVIGLPIKSSTMDGLDSLLSIVQMPNGIPVATVAINGAVNAALLAAQIIATSDMDIYNKLVAYKAQMAKDVLQQNENIKLLCKNI